MSQLQDLKTSERDTTVTPYQLRTAGYIPATVYGQGQQSQSIQVRMHEFYHAFLQGKRDFQLNGYVSGPATVKNMLRNPVTQQPISLEFHLSGGAAGNNTSKKPNKAKEKASV